MSQAGKFDWMEGSAVQALLAACKQVGIEVRFVGGCVRDALLGREVKDIDLATPSLPQEVLEKLQAAGIKTIPTGLQHGTITAVVEGVPFEITTLRHDVECDGRHAEVAFTADWEADAMRRDFTINALYLRPDGAIDDYTSGLADLENRQLRFIGDARLRIKEDALRILRYYRFQSQLGFSGTAEAQSACAELHSHIANLSGERIRQEMPKLFEGAALSQEILDAMHTAGLPPLLFDTWFKPDLQPVFQVENMLGEAAGGWVRLGWIVQQACSVYPACFAFVQNCWKLSNKEAGHLHLLLEPMHRLKQGAGEREQKAMLRELGDAQYRECVLMSWAETMAENGKADGTTEQNYRAMLCLPEYWHVPAFPVSGNDLIEKGMQPGPMVGVALKALEAAWEASGYTLDKNTLLKQLG